MKKHHKRSTELKVNHSTTASAERYLTTDSAPAPSESTRKGSPEGLKAPLARARGSAPGLVVFEVVTLGLGGLTALLTSRWMNVYEEIVKPGFAPPKWAFPAAWTVLYALMAYSALRVWRKKGPGRRTALAVYALQLAVNLAWPWLFFALKAFGLAFVWLLLLWALVIAMEMQFYRQDKQAFWLNIPYWCWVTFAAALNFAIANLNA